MMSLERAGKLISLTGNADHAGKGKTSYRGFPRMNADQKTLKYARANAGKSSQDDKKRKTKLSIRDHPRKSAVRNPAAQTPPFPATTLHTITNLMTRRYSAYVMISGVLQRC
jgi:hypothetical protein